MGATHPSELDSSERGTPPSVVIPLLILSMLGMLTILFVTRQGIGLTTDSIATLASRATSRLVTT